MIKNKSIILALMLSISLFSNNCAYAKKHRLLMNMAEIGVERYVMKHEIHQLGLKAENRILMKSGERISLDELKKKLIAHRDELNRLSEKEKMENDGFYIWRNYRLGTQGKWLGIKGESHYSLPNDKEYMDKTEQIGVNHSNGHPFLYDKDTARLTMEKPSGNSGKDIRNEYKRMGKIVNKGEKYVGKIFKDEKRTLHHTADGKSMVSVDRYVHANTPHSGGSSHNRKGIIP